MDGLLMEALTYLLIALLNVIAFYTYKWLNKHKIIKELEANKAIVQTVVKFVQEAYKNLNGQEKFNEAKSRLVVLMNEKGIKVSENEIEILIDSVVKEYKMIHEKWYEDYKSEQKQTE